MPNAYVAKSAFLADGCEIDPISPVDRLTREFHSSQTGEVNSGWKAYDVSISVVMLHFVVEVSGILSRDVLPSGRIETCMA